MNGKETLAVLDFDGFLVNSYRLLQTTFQHFGLNIGDEERFKHRRKFLKYLGGGKEFIRNFVRISLPKEKKIREYLTQVYCEEGRVYRQFVPVINQMIKSSRVHVGIISRNFTLAPGNTIRTVLKNSEIDEQHLDFVIPLPVGGKKTDVLEGMKSSCYKLCIFGADEISDYNAASTTGYNKILMASYGFDNRKRLVENGEIPEEIIYDSPIEIADKLDEIYGNLVKMKYMKTA